MLRAECPGKSQKTAEDLLGKKHVRAGRNLETMESCSFHICESPALSLMNTLIPMPSRGVSSYVWPICTLSTPGLGLGRLRQGDFWETLYWEKWVPWYDLGNKDFFLLMSDPMFALSECLHTHSLLPSGFLFLTHSSYNSLISTSVNHFWTGVYTHTHTHLK